MNQSVTVDKNMYDHLMYFVSFLGILVERAAGELDLRHNLRTHEWTKIPKVER